MYDQSEASLQFLIDCHRFLATYAALKSEALDLTNGDAERAQQLVLTWIQDDPELVRELSDLADRATRLPESRYTRLFTDPTTEEHGQSL